MAIFDTFLKQKRREEKAGKPDVYRYDILPEVFRIQVVHLMVRTIGNYLEGYKHPANETWDAIFQTIREEHGLVSLGDPYDNSAQQCISYLLKGNLDEALSLIQVAFYHIEQKSSQSYGFRPRGVPLSNEPHQAVQELNHRFKENGIGYQYEGVRIIKIDSQYLHSETILPALMLLQEKKFAGAADEFRRGHEYYRKKDYKAAISEALKAFESTMKTIHELRGWSLPSNPTARPLIQSLMSNGLFPTSMQDYLNQLLAVMVGLATVRNTTSGHGQGVEITEAHEYLASYALHMAAANIVFVVEAHKAKK